jgi:hypothetical protein
MKIGFSLPNIGPIGTAESVTKVAQRAEALGYSSLWNHRTIAVPREATEAVSRNAGRVTA